MSKFEENGPKVYSAGDESWKNKKKSRYHFYFFVEYMLQSTTYAVGDLCSEPKTFC